MAYKWKPSKAQKAAFIEKMNNPLEKLAYEQRKAEKADKRRKSSKFDYNTAGGEYIPTLEQYSFCMRNMGTMGLTSVQEDAFNIVISGYSCQEKVHHDYIHVVNELRRANPNS